MIAIQHAAGRDNRTQSSRWLRFCALAVVSQALGGCVGSGDARIPIFLVPVAMIYQAGSDEVATYGALMDKSGTNCCAYCQPVSDGFGPNQLHQLSELLNSQSFQAPLTNFNCGAPVPAFTFQVTLYKASRRHAGARRVQWVHSPDLDFAGRGRCLSAGLYYLVEKAFAKIDPDPAATHGGANFIRQPHCDCSKRDSKEEWVTYPGPNERLW